MSKQTSSAPAVAALLGATLFTLVLAIVMVALGVLPPPGALPGAAGRFPNVLTQVLGSKVFASPNALNNQTSVRSSVESASRSLNPAPVDSSRIAPPQQSHPSSGDSIGTRGDSTGGAGGTGAAGGQGSAGTPVPNPRSQGWSGSDVSPSPGHVPQPSPSTGGDAKKTPSPGGGDPSGTPKSDPGTSSADQDKADKKQAEEQEKADKKQQKEAKKEAEEQKKADKKQADEQKQADKKQDEEQKQADKHSDGGSDGTKKHS